MNDIYSYSFFDINFFDYYLVFIFIIILIIILNFLVKKNTIVISNNFDININEYSNEGLDKTFRDYFNFIGLDSAYTKTLEEIKEDISSNDYNINYKIIQLFEENYLNIFSKKDSSKNEIEKNLNKIKELI